MKLRRTPEDFIVEEICDLPTNSKKDNYSLYLAEKKGINTLTMLDILARANGIPRSVFGIAGLKDKHAITRQYVAVPSKHEITKLNIKNSDNSEIKVKFIGYIPSKLRLGDHKGNKFTITVRDITKGDVEAIYQRAETIEEWGVPNYFDSQRFGSFHDETFIGKYILKKDFENAVRNHCIYGSSSDTGRLDNERSELDSIWPNFTKINLSDRELSGIISAYKTTKDWLKAYLAIKPGLRELYLSAYQSYLWNECVKSLLFRHSKKKYSVDYKAGKLLFLSEKPKLPVDTFPTISDQLICDGEIKEIVEKAMSKEEITIEDLNIKELTGNFLKTYQRQIIVKPADFIISKPEKDEFYENRFKIQMSFSLPSGSFATVITKRLFGK